MRRLQEQSGVKPSRPQRVDFLYEGPAAGQHSNEEYLTGKKVEDKGENEVKEVRRVGPCWSADGVLTWVPVCRSWRTPRSLALC